jgi:hypothetical protein
MRWQVVILLCQQRAADVSNQVIWGHPRGEGKLSKGILSVRVMKKEKYAVDGLSSGMNDAYKLCCVPDVQGLGDTEPAHPRYRRDTNPQGASSKVNVFWYSLTSESNLKQRCKRNSTAVAEAPAAVAVTVVVLVNSVSRACCWSWARLWTTKPDNTNTATSIGVLVAGVKPESLLVSLASRPQQLLGTTSAQHS